MARGCSRVAGSRRRGAGDRQPTLARMRIGCSYAPTKSVRHSASAGGVIVMIGKLARLLARRPGAQRILVKREAALGDVLFTTPVVARLRRQNPGAAIYIQTGHPDVYRHNPHISGIVAPGDRRTVAGFDRVIDLDMAYENRRELHQLDALMEVAFGDHGEGHAREIVFRYADPPRLPPDLAIDWRRAVAVHLAKTWPSRMFPTGWWREIGRALLARGYQLVVLGKEADFSVVELDPGNVVDTRERLTLEQQAGVIAGCRLFIASPSGLVALSAATPTPTIFMPTITRADRFLPYRNGVQGQGFIAIEPDIPCYGCDVRQPGKSYWECERGDNACLGLITPDMVVTAALGVLGTTTPLAARASS
jgi:ADP-heptose:LPS heptosyltransferase